LIIRVTIYRALRITVALMFEPSAARTAPHTTLEIVPPVRCRPVQLRIDVAAEIDALNRHHLHGISAETLTAFDRAREPEDSAIVAALVGELDHDTACGTRYHGGIASERAVVIVDADAGSRIARPTDEGGHRGVLRLEGSGREQHDGGGE
jgi:hypothetical protein